MKPTRPWKVILTLTALVLVSAATGFLAGIQFKESTNTRRFDPENWNVYAMQSLEARLDLTEAQQVRIQAIVDRTVDEMKAVHQETIQKTVNIVNQLLSAIDHELTPEQSKIAKSLSPSSEELTIDLLKVGKKAPPGSETSPPAETQEP